MATRKKNKIRKTKKLDRKILTEVAKALEIAKKTTREKHERFFIQFSDVHMNAVLLFILAGTFLTAGVVNYASLTGEVEAVGNWLVLIIIAILSFTASVSSITLSSVFRPLKIKRILEIISFIGFLFGAIMFLQYYIVFIIGAI